MTPPETPPDHPEFGFDALEELRAVDRRQAPGRRTVDLEHEVVASTLAAFKTARRSWVAICAFFSSVSAVVTFLLMLPGLRIVGAAELGTMRVAMLHADSVLEAANTRQDSLIAGNRRQIEDLKKKDRTKMIVLCLIAQKMQAEVGGYCTDYLNPVEP